MIYTQKNINRVFWLIFIVLLGTMIDNYFTTSNTAIILGLYILQGIIIIKLAFNENERLISFISKPLVLISTLLIIINFAISPYESEFPLLFKYFGYIVAVAFGIGAAESRQLKLPKILLYGLVFLPLILVAFFDTSSIKNTFFPNTNNFVFWGACISLLYYIASQDKNRFRNSMIILIMYILIGSTIGIIVALLLSIIIINFKKPKYLIFTLTSITILLICIKYSDISVFARIRGVIDTMSVVTAQDLRNIEDLNIYELNQYSSYGERADSGSALWRIKHWIGLLTSFFTNWETSVFVGLGDNFTMSHTGHHPHNDILKILCEYGLIILFSYIFYLFKAYKYIKYDKSVYIILTILIYHFSENLIHTFPTNFIFYFAVGYIYKRVSRHQTV